MRCADVQEDLALYLLGELSPERLDAIGGHLASGCVECNQTLTQLEQGLTPVWDALEPEVMDETALAFVQQTVFERIRSSPQRSVQPAVAIASQSTPRRGFGRRAAWLCPAALVAGYLLAVVLGLDFMQDQVGAGRSAAGPGGNATRTDVPLRYIRFSSGADLPGNEQIVGRVLYDSSTREVHFFCRNLVEPAAGSEYVLAWTSEDGQLATSLPVHVDHLGIGRVVAQGVKFDEASQVMLLLRDSPLDSTVQ